MDTTARRLGVSRRTLQRRLSEEGTSFNAVMRQTRESLARHYLVRTNLSSSEIAYLLGFEERGLDSVETLVHCHSFVRDQVATAVFWVR